MLTAQAPVFNEDSEAADRVSAMRVNWLTLAFQNGQTELEQPFLDNLVEGSRQHVRYAIAMGGSMIAAFGLLDWFVLGAELGIVSLIRFGFIIPVAVFTVLWTFTDWFRSHSQLFLTLVTICAGLGLTAILVLVPLEVSALYFAGNMLVLIFTYTFLRLRFIYATTSGWLIVLVYPLAALVFNDVPFEMLLTNVFFTAASSLMGMFVAYDWEYSARRNFFLQVNLEQRRKELEESHNELEKRVDERTRAAMTAARAKAEFLANMSHEIRTPMNGVLGMLDLLRDTPLDGSQKEKLETAFNSAQGLLSIINDVLDLSKIEAGKMELHEDGAVPNAVIEEVVALLYPQATQKGLELVTFLEPEGFRELKLDGARLRQVVFNLVGNALKFTQRGEVRVECALVDGELRIAVIDSGMGIEQAKQKELFDAFSQADNSSARQFGGTGLGLAITKQLVELMGGTIKVSSQLGLGSEFTLTIPIESSGDDSESMTSRALFRRVFLLVDSQLQHKSLRLLLRGLGCELSELSEAEAILTDNGDVSAGELPVVRLSDSAGNDAHRRMLSKPVTRRALEEALLRSHETPRVHQPKSESFSYLGKSVLLVEDNLVNQRVALAMLERFGLSVELADGGQAALKLLQGARFDLIFMDCQMPGMDGFETTAEIRRLEAVGDLKPSIIVALTANAMEGDRQHCLNAGMDDYLAKPINLKNLEATLQRWLTPGIARQQTATTASDPVSPSDKHH
jgi:signal transduction histidine kinase/CheY-like chemotaxis protein